MDGIPQYPGQIPRQTQYPDPEASSSAWPTSSLPSHPNNVEGFSLENSRAEFQSASARQRSRSRELSEESDFLQELSDNE